MPVTVIALERNRVQKYFVLAPSFTIIFTGHLLYTIVLPFLKDNYRERLSNCGVAKRELLQYAACHILCVSSIFLCASNTAHEILGSDA